MIQKPNTARYTKFLDPIMTVAQRYNRINLFTRKDGAYALLSVFVFTEINCSFVNIEITPFDRMSFHLQ